jgi:signal transduction histidine kinase
MIAYVGFNTTRKFQQNKVWVGMAKETAHQIGTPLSSLLAWVEYMREVKEPPTEEVLFEMEKDLERLQIITERFSKIGSTPEYQSLNVYDLVNESVTYLSKRISKKVIITILNTSDKDIYAKINRNLFSWVIENLTKNAVDAMLGEGKIIFNLYVFKNDIIIDVADTGKGIQKSQFTKVFEPGFTTKKRGWGLGLSLAKRIIEEYHQGRIFVKDSEIGKGTTFRIMLTKINSNQSS